MKKGQMIISISREYGSGGHHIAKELAERFEIELYDRNLLDHVFAGTQTDVSQWEKVDEKPSAFAFSKALSGSNKSSEYMLAQKQFDFLREKADSGESFVVVGRCSEQVLKDYEGLIPIFIRGDKACRIKRVMESREMNEKTATETLERHDRLRKRYHNSFCDHRWGDSRYYDVCVNSSRLGIEGTAALLENFIRSM